MLPVTQAGQKRAEEDLRDSHREAELFINAVPSILIGLDAQGRINRWNDAATQTFALPSTEVLGKPLATCGIKWLTPDFESALNARLQSERRVFWDGVRFEKNSEPRLLGMTINWINLPASGRGELLIVGSDVTEKKHAEEDLRSKTAFLEAQIQATIDGILVVDERGAVAFHNQRFFELFDIPQSLSKSRSDQLLLQYVLDKIEDPISFSQKVSHLYLHKHETSRDEIKFCNGTVLDRYSSPVFGKDGKYYGRI